MTDRSAPVFYVKASSRGKKGEPTERVDVSSRVTSFTFEDTEKKADKLSITVDNHDLTQLETGFWAQGQVLTVAFGYADRLSPAREAVIKKVTGSRQLKVEAHAKSVLMDREKKSRTFENKTRSQVVTEIAEENGYTGEALDVQDTEVELEAITQARLSDAQFLRHLAQKEGFEFWVDFTGLHWKERDFAQQPIRELIYFTDPGRGDILTWNVENDISKKPSRVTYKGRDPKKKKDTSGTGDNDTTSDRAVAGDVIEMVDRRTGETTAKRYENTSNDETHPTSETSDAAAARAAKGRYKRGQANTVQLTLSIVGDPDLLAKSVIHVKGIGDKLSGRYYVSTATHKLTGSYTTALKCKRNASSSGRGLGGAQGIAAQGDKNKKGAKKDQDKLEPIEKVDRRTGATSIQYRDTRGKEEKKK